MGLITKAETITVDDLTLTLSGKKLAWEPPEASSEYVRWQIDHSLQILGDRMERLLACREALDAVKAGKK